jgi:hypothetical protein
MIVPLPVPRFQAVDVWALLPSSRREQAQDYHHQGQPAGRIRYGFRLLGHLHGYQDEYTACADGNADAGWEITCTCGRRMPCAHVGALLLAWADQPETFRAWERLGPTLPANPAWAWAAGAEFPWTAVEAEPPWWTLPPDDNPPDRRVGVADTRGSLSERHQMLRRHLQELHAAWWDEPEVPAAIQTAVNQLALSPVPVLELGAWAAAAGDFPGGLLAPLWARPEAAEPLVEASLRREWWDARARLAVDARPSERRRLESLTVALADWLLARGRDDEALATWPAVAAIDPYGFRQSDWLYRHGYSQEAYATLARAPLPRDAELLQERLARLRLFSGEAGAAVLPPE